MPHYEKYYDDQVTGSGGAVDGVYVGTEYQRGHGIGSFLGGLFRRALPLIKSGARTVGKEALRTGVNIVNDMQDDTTFRQALRNRALEAGLNLKRKATDKLLSVMSGSGYKTLGAGRGLQSTLGLGAITIKKKRLGVGKKKKKPVKKRKTANKRGGVKTSKNKKNKPKKIVKKERKGCCKKRSLADIFGSG